MKRRDLNLRRNIRTCQKRFGGIFYIVLIANLKYLILRKGNISEKKITRGEL